MFELLLAVAAVTNKTGSGFARLGNVAALKYGLSIFGFSRIALFVLEFGLISLSNFESFSALSDFFSDSSALAPLIPLLPPLPSFPAPSSSLPLSFSSSSKWFS